MFIRLLSPLLLGVLIAGCSQQPSVTLEQQFLNDVTTAMGGRDVIASAQTLVIEAEGTMQNVGQDLTPEAATMQFDISDYRTAFDLGSGSSRTEMVRTPLFDYFRGPAPMRLTYGLAGEIAYDVAADGTARRATNSTARERRSVYYHHPLPLLHALVTDAATLGNVRNEEGRVLAEITTAAGPVLTLAVDAATYLPENIRSTEHHFYLRDVVRTTRFAGTVSVDGLQLPATISESLDEFLVSRLQVTEVQVNGGSEDLSAPAQAASVPAPSGLPPANVTAEQLGEGVWLLAGQSHHSVLIEFNDHLLLIEAPNESRTLAVIAKAEALVPGKPLTHLVNTHHHFDHSGGLRTAIARGLTIVTQAANADFYRRMAVQPSTIVPDTLARSPQPLKLEIVNDELTMADDSMTLELYHVAESPHSLSMLMAYLPEQRLLIEADLYTPGRSAPQLFAPNLLENIRRNELEIDHVVPIHGGVIDIAELENAVAALQAAE